MLHRVKQRQQLWHLTLGPEAKGLAEPQEKVLTPPQFAVWGLLPPHGDVGRGRSRRRDSQPDRTAGFPEPRLTCQGGGNPGKGEDGQGEWHRRSVRPLRPTGSQEGGGRQISRPLPAAPRSHRRETPSPSPNPSRPVLGRSAKAPPNQGGLEGWSAAKSTQHRAQPRPFLHNRTRAPAPPLSGGARARPLRAHRDYALPPPSRTESYPAPPPTPLTHPHASRPPALREAEEVSPPPKYTPSLRRYPPPGSPPRPRPGVLSPQSCFGRSSLRVPLGVSLWGREAPRTARSTGPPKRTGSRPSA
ncbi:hypothetical protein CapIbe_018241, partial [Capra ibex]